VGNPNRHTMLFSNWIKCGIDDNVKNKGYA